MSIKITTGSREQISTFIGLPVTPFDTQAAANAALMPDPSQIVGDVFGTDLSVWEAMLRIDADKCLMNAHYLACRAINDREMNIFCEGGWHRSVALGEKIKHLLEADGYEVQITHLGDTANGVA
ncbi:hypothetical protein WG936_05390 [Corynebacterium sp. H127]|uniref:RapZ C-terminal domain-containing protein n=1 Tax=Corynebacterium sp. H127 TaxID=3133418 RepID=UPI0030B23AE2